jgi:dTDP-glucose pyrophosphorylase
MPYPAELTPSSRQYDPGDFPQRVVKYGNGAEVRMLYGNRRTNMKLSLQYQNVSDGNANAFLSHYRDETFGTYATFQLDNNANVFSGWGAGGEALNAPFNRWRYESAPVVENVRPGRSNVSVTLIGVLE